jgi:hypothetical protein
MVPSPWQPDGPNTLADDTQYITGLDDNDFAELVNRIETILVDRGQAPGPKRTGRPPLLDLTGKVALTLALLRTNMTQQTAAEVFGLSQPTVSLVKSTIEPLIDQALMFTGISLSEAATTRPLVVDGTYVPTGNRRQTGRTNYSGKRHCQCLSIQVACDLDGGLLATSTPVAGARHDAAAIELTGWQHILHDANWVADTAYQATTAITPIRKPPGAELPEAAKQFNHQISGLRCVVERCISDLKNWRIISRGYRRQLKKLPFTIALITKLELYRLGW